MHPDVTVTFHVAAPPRRVAAIIRDVERWHEWTASIRRVKLLGTRPFGIGATALVRQPRLPPALWRVTWDDENSGFVWESRGPGFSVSGIHMAEPMPGGSRVTLGLKYRGLFATLLARLTRGITVRYVNMEAEGLKRRAERPV